MRSKPRTKTIITNDVAQYLQVSTTCVDILGKSVLALNEF